MLTKKFLFHGNKTGVAKTVFLYLIYFMQVAITDRLVTENVCYSFILFLWFVHTGMMFIFLIWIFRLLLINPYNSIGPVSKSLAFSKFSCLVNLLKNP